ncbi:MULTISPECIES: hypothetical protein [Bradyrhizobium]|uniref:ATP-dependent DNA ligase n=1 Tax=Bradyrhizobium TaxID=374 RepID=UPI00140AC4D4|nr:hypothetical protein [Bradyrhizobium sp. 2S1]
MMVMQENDRVRLITKGGLDWSKRFPWIVESALKLRQQQFILDGEAVVLGVDGMSDFDALHSREHDQEAQFFAFDMLAGGGDDFRRLPLLLRKQNLAALLARGADGIHAHRSNKARSAPICFATPA